MKGSTHMAIGATIGVAAAMYYPFTMNNAALYIAVATVSALSADLDGPSMLTSKLTKLSKILPPILLGAGLLSIVMLFYQFVTQHTLYPIKSVVSLCFILVGLISNQGFIRNLLSSLLGVALIVAGFSYQMNWLMGLGIFAAIAPWLAHRGMTHTIWAVMLWSTIALGLEQQLQIEGIVLVATLGYVSHLVADTLTPKGVKWLYPLYKKSIKIP